MNKYVMHVSTYLQAKNQWIRKGKRKMAHRIEYTGSEALENKVRLAKNVLKADIEGLYGVMGHVGNSDYPPPRKFLNEFFEEGHDSCDQDGRIPSWEPFSLDEDEYKEIKQWWINQYPDATEDSLGVESWGDWVFIILHEL
ncbi:MAG: hypothetical protein ACKVH8_13460 [Pirellulales bacterium]|jgi:hypothetical protein